MRDEKLAIAHVGIITFLLGVIMHDLLIILIIMSGYPFWGFIAKLVQLHFWIQALFAIPHLLNEPKIDSYFHYVRRVNFIKK